MVNCPRGKELVNGKCLVKCKRSQERNAITNRCRKKTKSKKKKTKSKKRCPTGKERVGKSCLKKCIRGQKRRSQPPRRCIKKKTPRQTTTPRRREPRQITTPRRREPRQTTRRRTRRRTRFSPTPRNSPDPQDRAIMVQTTLERILEFLTEQGSVINSESLLKYVNNVKNLPRSSTSSSSQAIVDWLNVTGVVKIWAKNEPCLGAEYLIYKYVTPFLYFKNICPNVLIPISVGEESVDEVKEIVKKKKDLKKIKDAGGAQYVMTPYFQLHLDQFLKKNNFKKYIKRIFTTILFNIAGYSKFGLRHNDLHRENVRVNTLNGEFITQLKVNNEIGFEIKSDIDLIIFDFDRSGLDNPGQKYLKDIGQNYLSACCVKKNDEFCKDYHQCIPNDLGRKDILTFLIHMCEKSQELKTGKEEMEKFIKLCCTEEGAKYILKTNILKKELPEKKFWSIILAKDDQVKKWVKPAQDIIINTEFLNFMFISDNITRVTEYRGQEFSIEPEKYTQTNFKSFINEYFNLPQQVQEAVEVIEEVITE